MSHTSSATWISLSDRDQEPENTPHPEGIFTNTHHSCATCCNSFNSCNKIKKTNKAGRCPLAPRGDLQVTFIDTSHCLLDDDFKPPGFFVWITVKK